MSQTKAQLIGPLVADDITVTGTINFDSGTFKVDSTNDKVGIGTGANAPTKTLDVGGDTQIADLYYTADYPTARPTIDLAFDKVKKLDNRITFRRESIGTIVNSDGYIETVGHNKPRFDHDPSTRESLGLLIEEQRTNLIIHSENFENWTANGTRSTVTPNQIIGPDGTLSGAMINDSDSSTGNKNLYVYVSVTGNATYTASVYAKAGTSDWINFYFDDSNISFQFSTETVSLEPTAPTGATAGFENAGNGWYRIYVKDVNASSGSRPISFWTGANSQTYSPNYTGDPTKTVYVWGAQLEQGTFPTSYIPTNGSSVTRKADGVAFEGTNVTDWYNQSEGTWIVDTNKTQSIDGYYAALFYMRPTTGSDGTRNEFYKKNGSGLFSYRYGNNDGTVTGSIDTTNAITSGDNTLFAYYKQGDFGVGSNGTIDSTDTSGSVQVTTDPDIYLAIGSTFTPAGSGGSSEHWNGHFRRFTYYPYRLNNSQIANLTL